MQNKIYFLFVGQRVCVHQSNSAMMGVWSLGIVNVRLRLSSQAAVDVFSVSYPDSKNKQQFFSDGIDNPVIAGRYAV